MPEVFVFVHKNKCCCCLITFLLRNLYSISLSHNFFVVVFTSFIIVACVYVRVPMERKNLGIIFQFIMVTFLLTPHFPLHSLNFSLNKFFNKKNFSFRLQSNEKFSQHFMKKKMKNLRRVERGGVVLSAMEINSHYTLKGNRSAASMLCGI